MSGKRFGPLLGPLLLAAACSLAPSNLPPLPDLPLDSFSPALRKQVEEPYQLAKSRPSDAEAAGELGLILQAYRQVNAAEKCFERARRLAPESFRWAYYLGLAQAAAGKFPEAAATFAEAMKQKPDYEAGYVQWADALLQADRPEEAEKLYRQVIARTPDYAQAYYGLGRIAAARRQSEEAIESYRKAVELAPGYAAARYALSLAYRQAGGVDQADYHLRVYEKDKLSSPPNRDELLQAVSRLNQGPVELVKQGQRLEAEGKLKESVAVHLEALRLDPKFEQAYVNLISLYGRMGDEAKAEQSYHDAVRLNPNLAEAHYNYGVLLFGKGRKQEARQAFEKAIASNPNYPEAQSNLGYLLMEEGKLDQAARRFQKALANSENHRLANYHLARILLHKGRLPDAVAHLEKTIQPKDGQTPGFLYALAAAYARFPDAAHKQKAYAAAREAQSMAEAFGQRELAERIGRDLPVLARAAGAKP